MKKKISVSIAIPTYNEGKNIKQLLLDILRQKHPNFSIEKILIVDDGSTDNTRDQVKLVKDKRIILKTDVKRRGKVTRLNYAFQNNSSDVLIQLDADIRLKNLNTFSLLVQPFIMDKTIAVVYGNQIPMTPQNYIGKLAYFGFYTWEEAKKMVQSDRYNVFGQVTTFSKKFLQHYRLPEEAYYTEDTYSFYFAKRHGYNTFFEKNAVVYFNLPSTVSDYTKQMNRYLTTVHGMRRFYDKDLIHNHETITGKVKLEAFLKNSLRSPAHIVIGYVFLHSIPKLRSFFFNQNVLWETIKSSK